MNEKDFDRMDLYAKPKSYKFTEEEKALIRKDLNKNEFEIFYALYKKKSKKGLYIVFVIDQMSNSHRRSLVMNNWDIICKRPICDIEFEEMVANYEDRYTDKVWLRDNHIHKARKKDCENSMIVNSLY